MVIVIEEKYLWLLLIKGLDYYVFIKLINTFETMENIYEKSKNKYLFKQILYSNNVYISNEIIFQITNSVIKNQSKTIYQKLKLNNIKIVGILTNDYPENLKKIYMPPLGIFCLGNTELLGENNIKNHTYYSKDFSCYGNKVYKLMLNYNKTSKISNVFNEEIKKLELEDNSNLISKCNIGKNIIILKNNILEILENEKIDFIEKIKLKNINLKDNLFIFFCYDNYFEKSSYEIFLEYFTGVLDCILIPESSYNKEIYVITSLLLEQGKDIHVVPGNIYTSSSYFSNFLLKEGANMILNKYDLEKYYY